MGCVRCPDTPAGPRVRKRKGHPAPQPGPGLHLLGAHGQPFPAGGLLGGGSCFKAQAPSLSPSTRQAWPPRPGRKDAGKGCITRGCEAQVLSCVRGKDTKAPGHLQTSAASPPRPRGGPLTLVAQQGQPPPRRGILDSGVRGDGVWLPSDPGEVKALPDALVPSPVATAARGECRLTAHRQAQAPRRLTGRPRALISYSIPELLTRTSSSSKDRWSGQCRDQTRTYRGSGHRMSGQGPTRPAPRAAGLRGASSRTCRLGVVAVTLQRGLACKVKWGQPEATQGVQGSQTGSNHHVFRQKHDQTTLPPPMDISSEQASQGLGSTQTCPLSPGDRLTLEHILGVVRHPSA